MHQEDRTRADLAARSAWARSGSTAAMRCVGRRATLTESACGRRDSGAWPVSWPVLGRIAAEPGFNTLDASVGTLISHARRLPAGARGPGPSSMDPEATDEITRTNDRHDQDDDDGEESRLGQQGSASRSTMKTKGQVVDADGRVLYNIDSIVKAQIDADFCPDASRRRQPTSS